MPPRLTRRLLTVGLTASIASACAQTPPRPSVSPNVGTPRDAIWPAVAAHQHLMSPAAQALVPPVASLPAVTPPPEIDQLLRRREQVSGTPPSGDLFTDDGMIQDTRTGRWQRGRAQIDQLLGSMAKGVRYVPNAYGADGSAGFVSGTVRVGRSADERLNFSLGLRKSATGAWQIASEVFTLIPPAEYAAPVTADQLIAELDDAGIARGVVLSVGYWFGDPRRQIPPAEAAAKTRAENDWTVAQVARYPGRLVAFCGVNPLADYAVDELARCATIPQVKGMKIHLGNSGVDVKNPDHVARLRRFFAAANARRMPILAHLRQRGGYTREHARIILDSILPAAPDVTIQIAHMGTATQEPDEATAVFADAVAAGDPRVQNVIFDITQTVASDGSQSPATLAGIAATLRRIGLDRIYFGTDMTVGLNPPPREHWKTIRRLLPLTDDELRVIAQNVPPYLR
jgi:predicted TIM-barrel fold metal-dependent hydrolase